MSPLRCLLLLFAFETLTMHAQENQGFKVRPPLDVPAIVEGAESMQFIVYRFAHDEKRGPLHKGFFVRNDRREDLFAIAQKLKEGRPVPQGFRNMELGYPLVEFYVGNTSVLRLHLFGDRVICSAKGKGSIDLYFGVDGAKELERLVEDFIGPRVPW